MSLKRVVHVLYTLSTNATLGESVGLVVRRKHPYEFHVPSKAYSTAIPTNESNIRLIRRITRSTYHPSSLCVHFCVLRVSP